MTYCAMIYVDEKSFGAQSYSDANIQASMKFEEWLATAKAGTKLTGEALQPITTGTTVRIRDGKRVVTDGPFAQNQRAT